VVKQQCGGYDGYGVRILAQPCMEAPFDGPILIEEKIDIDCELSVIGARNNQGQWRSYPSIMMTFACDRPVLRLVQAPAPIPFRVEQEIQKITEELAHQLQYTGLLTVEFFLGKDEKLYINEIAPRVHNSGHWTSAGASISQFSLHWLALMNQQLPTIHIKPHSGMLNILQKAPVDLYAARTRSGNEQVVFYEKDEGRPWRKLGHINVSGETWDDVLNGLDPWIKEQRKVGVR
jgi:5-(carboxyamino)imidazole ribonucleotide synthase